MLAVSLFALKHVESGGGQCMGCRFRGEETLAHYSPWSCGTIGPCLSPFEPEKLTHGSAHSCSEHSVRPLARRSRVSRQTQRLLSGCVGFFLQLCFFHSGVGQQRRRRRRWRCREAMAALARPLPAPEGRGPHHPLQRGAHHLQVGRHIPGVAHGLPHHRPRSGHGVPGRRQHHAHQLQR